MNTGASTLVVVTWSDGEVRQYIGVGMPLQGKHLAGVFHDPTWAAFEDFFEAHEMGIVRVEMSPIQVSDDVVQRCVDEGCFVRPADTEGRILE